MIEYFIDGSTKENMIGVGIVRVNEFGFIEKHHYSVEHIHPSSNIAEGYALEKTLEMIKEIDCIKKEMINIFTDSQKLYNLFLFNEKVEFKSSHFFSKQESNLYFQYIRNLYVELISRYSNRAIFHCDRTNQARPLLKIFYKEDLEDQRYLQAAHSLSRNYLKQDSKPISMELKAVRKNNKWYIVKNNKDIVAENKRPLIALSEALEQTDSEIKEIKLCHQLETLIKATSKNKIANESMRSAIKIIEKKKVLLCK